MDNMSGRLLVDETVLEMQLLAAKQRITGF